MAYLKAKYAARSGEEIIRIYRFTDYPYVIGDILTGLIPVHTSLVRYIEKHGTFALDVLNKNSVKVVTRIAPRNRSHGNSIGLEEVLFSYYHDDVVDIQNLRV